MTDQPKRRGRPAKTEKPAIEETATVEVVAAEQAEPVEVQPVEAKPKKKTVERGVEVQLLRKYVPKEFLDGGQWVENASTKETIKLHTLPARATISLKRDEANEVIRNGIATTTANSFNG